MQSFPNFLQFSFKYSISDFTCFIIGLSQNVFLKILIKRKRPQNMKCTLFLNLSLYIIVNIIVNTIYHVCIYLAWLKLYCYWVVIEGEMMSYCSMNVNVLPFERNAFGSVTKILVKTFTTHTRVPGYNTYPWLLTSASC